ncbi:MAG: nitrate reductase formation protein NapD [Geobacter sp.]|jgi:nitrate reductase NapD|nr:nitrate reductase formation protein NapD [Geobacter sp.]
MPVSGVVIRCQPGSEVQIAEQAGQLEGVEVHGVLPDGQVIAVIEAVSVNAEADLATKLQQLEGAISIQVAYHNFEDVAHEGGADGTDKA